MFKHPQNGMSLFRCLDTPLVNHLLPMLDNIRSYRSSLCYAPHIRSMAACKDVFLKQVSTD